MTSAPPSLEELRALDEFTVTLGGGIQRAPLTGARCVYSEWAHGEKDGDEWASWTIEWRSDAPFTARTPLGLLELVPGSVRPHVAPSLSTSWSPLSRDGAPQAVRALLAGRDRLLHVEEYLLAGGEPYHARVAAESYMLPPAPGEPRPRRRQNLVLLLSDQPFRHGKPPSPLTLAFRGRTY